MVVLVFLFVQIAQAAECKAVFDSIPYGTLDATNGYKVITLDFNPALFKNAVYMWGVKVKVNSLNECYPLYIGKVGAHQRYQPNSIIAPQGKGTGEIYKKVTEFAGDYEWLKGSDKTGVLVQGCKKSTMAASGQKAGICYNLSKKRPCFFQSSDFSTIYCVDDMSPNMHTASIYEFLAEMDSKYILANLCMTYMTVRCPGAAESSLLNRIWAPINDKDICTTGEEAVSLATDQNFLDVFKSVVTYDLASKQCDEDILQIFS